MDVPWWVSHYHVKFTQNLKIEVPQIAVQPLSLTHSLKCYRFLLSYLVLILFDVVDQFAVRIVTGVQMRTITVRFVCLLVYQSTEMLLCA